MLRAMCLGPQHTVTNVSGRHATPAMSGDLAEFLARLGRAFGPAGEGVIILDPDAAGAAGHPVEPRETTMEVGGWRCRSVGDWSTWAAPGRPTLRVCMPHLMREPDPTPLWGTTAEETVQRFALWHELTGSAYNISPGIAATAVLRAVTPGGKRAPTWRPATPGPDGVEVPYYPDDWRPPRPQPVPRFLHGYDSNRAFLASSANVLLAKEPLRSGPRTYNPADKLAGWWYVELAPWNDARLPDPAGYDPHGRIARWITSPTMELLHRLTYDDGIYGGVRVIESRVAPGTTVLRPLAHRLRDAYAGKTPDGVEILASQPAARVAAVRETLKIAGHKVLSSFQTPSNSVYRPDWWHSTVGMFRANQWRKMHATTAHNRWPAFIHVDNTWFFSDDPDPAHKGPDGKMYGPPGWEIDETGVRLGCYTHGGTKTVRGRREQAR